MTAPQAAMPRRHPLLTGLPGFVLATIGLSAIAGLLLSLGFRGPGDLRAITASAIVATVVQVAAFRAVRRMIAGNIMAGLAVGALVRLLGLVAYALIAGPALALPMAAALISLMVFYFLSMMIEPLFLRL